MAEWAWLLAGASIGLLTGWAVMVPRVKVWRAAAEAWEEATKTLDAEMRELQETIHPHR